MTVPDFQTLMLPVLQAADDGVARRLVPDITDRVAVGPGLSDSDLAQVLPSGTQTAFVNRCHWAATYMVKAGLLQRPKRAHIEITTRGRELLATKPPKVTIALLMQYPEFEVFRRSRAPVGMHEVEHNRAEAENPEEALFNAYTSWRKTVEAELLDRLRSEAYSWQSFERLVVDLLHAMGYGAGDEDRKRVTKMTGDDGIDGVIDEDRLGLDAVYIQAKNYGPAHKVGRPALQAFAGSLAGQRASKGVFITTSSFSSDAIDFVGRIPQRIVLIDGPTLARYMYDHGIGVRSKRSLDVKGLDDAYFEGDA